MRGMHRGQAGAVARIAIRREDKNRWERRAPLAPRHVRRLAEEHGVAVAVQPSPIRIFDDEEYEAAGATLAGDLSGCPIILGVKEVPVRLLLPGHTYLCFAHVIKGQAYNMPLLQRLLDLGCTLIDYERIVDDAGRRLIFFGRHAGYAGMIDALWALGQRLLAEGIGSPLAAVRQAHAYHSVEEATTFLTERVGGEIRRSGVPAAVHPLIFGFTGGGNVSQGAQEILDRLPVEELAPADLAAAAGSRGLSRRSVYKVVFRRRERVDFARYLPYLTVLVNGIFWQPDHPRLVTVADIRRLFGTGEQPRLRVLADLSCDLRGSIEPTVRITTPGEPVFVFDPFTEETFPGVQGWGPVVLAVDNLPAELPRDASEWFGDHLTPFLPELAAADLTAPLRALALPASLRRAVITHRGELAPDYRYLEEPLGRVAV